MQLHLKAMGIVLAGCEEFTAGYVDDLVIMSDSQDHIRHLSIVLEKIQKFHMTLRMDKCVFGMTEVQFLGFDVSSEGISPGVDKVYNKSRPSNVRDIQSFLGLANFFRNQVPGLSGHAAKLSKLTCKDAEWSWTDEQQFASDEIKRLISERIETVHPDPKFPFHVVVNVTEDAYTSAIFQEKGREVLPTHFMGGIWKSHKVNMSLIEKELTAFCYTIKKQYSVLMGNEIIIHPRYTYAEIFSQVPYLSDKALKCTNYLCVQ